LVCIILHSADTECKFIAADIQQKPASPYRHMRTKEKTQND